MGFFDKLMFWKTKDEFADIGATGLGRTDALAFGDDFAAQQNPSFNMPNFEDNEFAQSGNASGQPAYEQQYPNPRFSSQDSGQSRRFNATPSQFQQPPLRFESAQQNSSSKDFEILSSKLDTLRVSLENINQRLANLEAIARGEEEQGRRRRYY